LFLVLFFSYPNCIPGVFLAYASSDVPPVFLFFLGSPYWYWAMGTDLYNLTTVVAKTFQHV
jgi:hypothetical protein